MCPSVSLVQELLFGGRICCFRMNKGPVCTRTRAPHRRSPSPPLALCACAAELLTTPEIMCRAWDSSMNTQPNTFTW